MAMSELSEEAHLSALSRRLRDDYPQADPPVVAQAVIHAHRGLQTVGLGDDEDAIQTRLEAAAEARRALINFDRLGARPLGDRARRVLRDLGERLRPPRQVVTGDLSDRELQVVRLVADGFSNKEIADRLYISPRTVTTHLQHVYQRLGLASRTALIRWALDRGLASGNT